MKKIILAVDVSLSLLMCLFVCGCAAKPGLDSAVIGETPVKEPIPVITLTQAPKPTPTPTPTPTPVPQRAVVSVMGDIMMMQVQVNNAYDKELGRYDFTKSFYGLSPWLQAADLACANLETPLAGEEAGYSGPQPAQPTPDENGITPRKPFQTFNAPDDLAVSLKEVGFDLLTTANNHALDRGVDGLFRTIDALNEAGFLHTGTFSSQADRSEATLARVNGITLGFTAWTVSVNRNDGLFHREQARYAAGRMQEEEMLCDIQMARAAGADYIIAFVHWDKEFQHQPQSATKNRAKWLLENGVDCIIGSHPHVVQPIEHMTVQRPDGSEHTGLVAYSLGNLISNMAPSPVDYGVLVQLTLEKDENGIVTEVDAGYLPLYRARHNFEKKTLHEVIPALEDQSALLATGEITDALKRRIAACREHILNICGDQIRVLG